MKKSLIITILALLALAACSAQSANSNAAQPAAFQSTVVAPTAAPTLAALAPAPAATVATTVSSQTATQATKVPTSAPTKSAQAQSAAPACTSSAAVTDAVTEGPYFKAGSPERTSLIATGVTGTQLVLTGYVLTPDCKPVAHALLDFWQADANGNYDNSGYTLRGHEYTDASGRYQLTTIVPGLYPGRTEHIHVKVQAPNGPVLTTQLFFPGVAQNSSDGIFDPKLVMNVQNTNNGLAATFNFVVNP